MMTFDMAGISVMLAMPTHRDIPPQTVRSLLDTQQALHERGIRFGIEMQYGSSLVHHARTKAAWRFLQGDYSKLFWVDSDVSWDGADFVRLLAMSSRMDCVCALYPAKTDDLTFFINVENKDAEISTNEFGCIQVDGAGLGFAVISREVMQRLADRAPLLEFPDIDGSIPHIFRCDDSNGRARGEDMAFWADIRALGYSINVDPGIRLGHIGQKEYAARFLDSLRKLDG